MIQSFPLLRSLNLRSAQLGAFYPPAIRLAGAGLQFLNTILIARKLGDSGSSAFFFWSTIILTSAPMASYGLEQLVLRDVPREQDKGGNAVRRYMTAVKWISVSLAFLFGVGLLIYAGLSESWQSWQFLIPFGLVAMTSILISGEVLKGLSCPSRGVFFGHFVPVSLFTVTILVSGDDITSAGLIQMWMICFLVSTLFLRLARQPDILVSPFVVPESEKVKTLLSEGSSVWCSSIFGALSFLVPLAILKGSRPEVEISYVTTAFRISILFTILSVAIHSFFAPAISRAAESGDRIRLFQTYGRAVSFSLMALGPPLLVGILFPGFIMQIFGESFQAGAVTLRFLLIANLIKVLMGPVLQLLIMVGSSNLMPKLGAMKLIIAIAAGLILIPPMGGPGMVLAMTAAFLTEEILALKTVIFKKLRA